MSNTLTKRYSFEYFPPKTEAGKDKLFSAATQFDKLGGDFCSVTYGAGGSTRDTTQHIALEFKRGGRDVAPHLSFGADGEECIKALLDAYQEAGINRIVALRGDLPAGADHSRTAHANELVGFIRQHSGDYFNVEVAAYPEIHPESDSYVSDIFYLKQKMDAGASSAITQYFYNPDAYFCYVDECARAGIDQPIYPGIMPITNFNNLTRFSKTCGAEIPQWLDRRLTSYGDDQESIAAFSSDYVSHLCESLLEGGAPGLHFYTMNTLEPTLAIWNNLGLST